MNRMALFKPLVLSIVAVLLLAVGLLGGLDEQGSKYTNEAMTRALITFGVARGLNGVISVAQGTEIAVHPAGFGVNFTPGQILDPINDIVEQFSTVMLVSSASLGIQKVFLQISSSQGMNVLLAVVLLLFLLLIWRSGLGSPLLRKNVFLFISLVLFVRFSVPAVAIINDAVYQHFLAKQYQESSLELEQAKNSIDDLTKEDHSNATQAQEGLLDKAMRMIGSAKEGLDINKRIDKYQQSASQATQHAIDLIVVFVLQTIVFPLLFVGVFYKLIMGFWRMLLTGG